MVLLLWIPLRERPGLGTVLNVLVIGAGGRRHAGAWSTPPTALWQRVAFLVVGIFVFGPGSGLYIGAGLGPGPRDGLMTGLARRGRSVRVVRTGIELTALAIGAPSAARSASARSPSPPPSAPTSTGSSTA